MAMEKMEFPYQKEDSVLFEVLYRPVVDFKKKITSFKVEE